MVASFLPVAILLDYQILKQPLGLLALIARFCGIVGTVILLWEYLLSIRPVIGKFIPNIPWLINLHKNFGIYGFILILVHPILITIYYLNSRGINLIHLDISRIQDVYKDIGFIALCLLAVIWLTSALLRGKMTFRLWQKLHLLSYLILPLVLIHNIGFAKPVVPISGQVYWYVMLVIYLALVIVQILGALGITEVRYKLSALKHEANKVSTLILDPVKKFVQPHAGQFVYIQFPGYPEAHPFSISGINTQTHQIALTTKDLGKFSQRLQNLKPGDELIVEGPYGVFGQEIYTSSRAIVLIAGGIGITPFMPVVQDLASGWDKSVTLFYGNQTEADVTFLPELAQTEASNPKFKIVQVITTPVNAAQETGFITCEVLQRHLDTDLENYEFFVCGPPAMIAKLIPELKEYEVPKDQIHYELFSW